MDIPKIRVAGSSDTAATTKGVVSAIAAFECQERAGSRWCRGGV